MEIGAIGEDFAYEVALDFDPDFDPAFLDCLRPRHLHR
jgi:hypothetical protein